jgi:hypothetical protein
LTPATVLIDLSGHAALAGSPDNRTKANRIRTYQYRSSASRARGTSSSAPRSSNRANTASFAAPGGRLTWRPDFRHSPSPRLYKFGLKFSF